MKKIICILSILLPAIGIAQTEIPVNVFMKDANGRLLDGFATGYKMEGSPYLLKEYCNASIVTTRGKQYKNIPANINLETNELLFKTPENQVMAVSIPLSKVIFEGCEPGVKKVFLSGFSAIDRLNERSFYQLLDSGKALLLKSYQTNFSESRGYSESLPTRVYEQTTAYYVFLPAQGLVKIPRSITDVPGILEKEKKDILLSYIKTNQLKSRNEADLVRLLAYYNSL